MIPLNHCAGPGGGTASSGAYCHGQCVQSRERHAQGHLPHGPLGTGSSCRCPSPSHRGSFRPAGCAPGSVGPCIQILFENFLSSCRVTASSSPVPKQLQEGVWTPVPPKENGLRDFWSVGFSPHLGGSVTGSEVNQERPRLGRGTRPRRNLIQHFAHWGAGVGGMPHWSFSCSWPYAQGHPLSSFSSLGVS